MRRSEREFTDMQEIETLLSKVWVCRLALHNEPFPYIVPLNFGYVRDGERLTMYFHCAHEGTKIDLLRKNPHASFEVEGECAVVGRENACSFTAHYESVIGEGILSIAQGF